MKFQSSKQTKKQLFSILLGLALFIGAIPWSEKSYAAGGVVPDPALRKIINAELGRSDLTTDITAADMANLPPTLFIDNTGVLDLEGLQYATQLTHLTVQWTPLQKVPDLSALNQLQSVYFSNTKLNAMPKLKSDKLVDLSILGSGNTITALGDFSNTPNIGKLDLSGIHTLTNTSIQGIANLTCLKVLKLGDSASNGSATFSELSDLGPLRNLKNLNSLSVKNAKISDLSPLASVTSLDDLNLDYNRIVDITPLGNLNLSTLSLYNTLTKSDGTQLVWESNYLAPFQRVGAGITDISALKNMTNLQTLNLTGHRVMDLTPLSTFESVNTLRYLHLSMNEIENIVSLAALLVLDRLYANQNHITNVSPLKARGNNNSILEVRDQIVLRPNRDSFPNPLKDLNDKPVDATSGNVSVSPGDKTIIDPSIVSSGLIRWQNDASSKPVDFTGRFIFPPVITIAVPIDKKISETQYTVTIAKGTTSFTPKTGMSARDDYDGDLSSKVIISGTLDINTIGDYSLTYNVTNSLGLAAQEVQRTVFVRDIPQVSYRIEYYYDNILDNTLTITGMQSVGHEFTGFSIQAKAGYYFDKWTGRNPRVISANPEDNVWKYWHISQSGAKYRVEYYKDGQIFDYADSTVRAPYEVKEIIDLIPPGYVLDPVPSTLVDSDHPFTVSPANNVIKRYYKAVKGTPTVNLIFDGALHGAVATTQSALTILKDSSPTASEIPIPFLVEDGWKFEGWSLDGITIIQPTTITFSNNTTFYAVYSKSGNQSPFVVATDAQEHELGVPFDPLRNVYAWDREDGNLTKYIQVSGNVDVNQPGSYLITYTVVDSGGLAASKTITIVVKKDASPAGNHPPVLFAANQLIAKGDSFDSLNAVYAFDLEDGDLSARIQVLSNTVQIHVPGIYSVSYSVTDGGGLTVTKTISVVVKPSAVSPPAPNPPAPNPPAPNPPAPNPPAPNPPTLPPPSVTTIVQQPIIQQIIQPAAPTMSLPQEKPVLNTKNQTAYVTGYPNRTFGAERGMTRAEVAVMFYQLLENPSPMGEISRFYDVPSGEWYTKAVVSLNAMGVLNGYPDGNFGPRKSVTRGEFAAMAAKFANLSEPANFQFPDVGANHWARHAISLAVSKGWVSGYPDGTFRPQKPITRAEVVTITNRMLARSADKGFIDSNVSKLKRYIDLDFSYWAYYDIQTASNNYDYIRNENNSSTWTIIK